MSAGTEKDLARNAAHRSLQQVLESGDFAITTELPVCNTGSGADVIANAKIVAAQVDAINVVDGARAIARTSSLAVSAILDRLGLEPILQLACRDRNRIALQAELLGAGALAIPNVLCLTGDGVQGGDHPEARPVFDLDAVSLVECAKHMRDNGSFMSGREITTAPKYYLGATANPFVPPYEHRARLVGKKIRAGAQFIQTQYCYDIERFKVFMQQMRDLGNLENAHLIAGVGPLTSARVARWMIDFVPGVSIPDELITRLEQAEKPKAEGQRICIEQMQQLKEIDGVAGLHIMAFAQEQEIGRFIKESGVATGRSVPPGRQI